MPAGGGAPNRPGEAGIVKWPARVLNVGRHGLGATTVATTVRPAAAVDARKRRLLSQTALDYLGAIHHPPVKIRFDIVEVLLGDGQVREIRHLPNTFPLSRPYRYG